MESRGCSADGDASRRGLEDQAELEGFGTWIVAWVRVADNDGYDCHPTSTRDPRLEMAFSGPKLEGGVCPFCGRRYVVFGPGEVRVVCGTVEKTSGARHTRGDVIQNERVLLKGFGSWGELCVMSICDHRLETAFSGRRYVVSRPRGYMARWKGSERWRGHPRTTIHCFSAWMDTGHRR